MIRILKSNRSIWKLISKIIMINPFFFWKIRKVKSRSTIEQSLSDNYFLKVFSSLKCDSICELGCGKGDRLFFLQKQNIAKQYLGYDLNTSFVDFGNYYSKKNDYSVNLKVKNYLDLNEELNCDFVISSMSLIYLNYNQLSILLNKIKKFVKEGFVLQELITDGNSIKESYYAHNYKELFKQLSFLDDFDITYEVIDYEPWKKGRSIGTQIVVIRK